MRRLKFTGIGLGLGAVLLGGLTGCVGEVGERRYATVSAPPPPGYVESEGVVSDDYVYYPAYQVYYSGSRRQYVYLEGRSWVYRPAPPRVSASVLLASPSVRLDFHDAPSGHHAEIIRQYPKHWVPSNSGHGNQAAHGDGDQKRRD